MQEDPAQLVDETEVRDERTPRYRLPVFEGPLDLLLYLIQKNEIDIADIPIARITEQYTAYLDQMRELDLEIAADFVLMAATLIHIKTRMLLPVSRESGDDQGLDDPRIPLVEQLMEYKRFKEIARLLQEKEEAESAQFPRAAAGQLAEMEPALMELDVDLFDLVEALQRVLKRAVDRRERLVFAPEVTLAERITFVLDRLESHGSMLFEELFETCATRMQIVVTFLAVLELAKQKVVRLFQEAPLQPFRVVLAS